MLGKNSNHEWKLVCTHTGTQRFKSGTKAKTTAAGIHVITITLWFLYALAYRAKTKLWETVEMDDPESPKHCNAAEHCVLALFFQLNPASWRISNLVDRCKQPMGHLADMRRLGQHCWSLCLATHSASQTEHLKATQHVRYKTTENEGLCQTQNKKKSKMQKRKMITVALRLATFQPSSQHSCEYI